MKEIKIGDYVSHKYFSIGGVVVDIVDEVLFVLTPEGTSVSGHVDSFTIVKPAA